MNAGEGSAPNLAFDVAAIPLALREHPQWLNWVFAVRNGKPTKIPICSRSGGVAKANDPRTWADFPTAVEFGQRRQHGLGFVFTDDDPFSGVDFDGCRNPATQTIAAWAQRVLRHFETYAETSIGQRGVKAILQGKFPGRGRRRGKLEVYCRTRFFALTGSRLGAFPAEPQPRQGELDAFMKEMFPERQPALAMVNMVPTSLSDFELIERASRARNGSKFTSLWQGAWQHLYGSQSEADAALCGMLRFWVGDDPTRIDALFRQSKLARAKWTERADYRESTLHHVLRSGGEVFRGRRSA